MIPGHNDSEAELRDIAGWIAGDPRAARPMAHLTVHRRSARMGDVPPTPAATLRRAADIGREAGLRYVYVGNAPELHLEDTACAGCGLLLVERRGYRSASVIGPAGECPGCGRPLEGRWPAAVQDSWEATP